MTIRTPYSCITVLAVASVLAGCATGGSGASTVDTAAQGTPAAAAASDPNVRIVKSRDGNFEGEMVGTAAPGSKFAQLQIGMELLEVQKLIGVADQQHTHETGKRWIPFYYGNDVRRLQMVYAGEGCLAFTGGNQFGGGGNELIRIEADPSGACYQP